MKLNVCVEEILFEIKLRWFVFKLMKLGLKLLYGLKCYMESQYLKNQLQNKYLRVQIQKKV